MKALSRPSNSEVPSSTSHKHLSLPSRYCNSPLLRLIQCRNRHFLLRSLTARRKLLSKGLPKVNLSRLALPRRQRRDTPIRQFGPDMRRQIPIMTQQSITCLDHRRILLKQDVHLLVQTYRWSHLNNRRKPHLNLSNNLQPWLSQMAILHIRQ